VRIGRRGRCGCYHFVAILLLAAQATELCAQQDTTRVRRDTVAVRLPTLDVTATATRSTRKLIDQPAAITEIKPGDWFGAKGVGLDEALKYVPGMLAQSHAGWTDTRLVIRGYGARGAGDRNNSGTARGVRVLIDGFPETEPDGRTSLDLVDLGTMGGIDVIRSNASAVWGNAAGGIVSVSTLSGAKQPYGFFEPTFGSFGFKRYLLSAGYQPGNSEVGGTALWSASDGWRDHSDGERSLVNVAINAAVGTTGRLGVFATGGHNVFRIPGPLTAEQVAENPQQANATYQARDERRDNRVGRLGMIYEAHPSARSELRTSLYAAPKYLQRSERGTYRDFTRYHVGGSALYRYRSAIGSNAASVFNVGLDEAYQDGAILFYSLTPSGGRGETLRDNKREGANNFGFFAQEELTLGDRWDLNLGARYDNITYYSQSFIDPTLNDRKSFTKVSPKLGAVYRLNPTRSLYASIGGGVEAPAGNETDPAGTYGQDTVYAINPLLDPITSTTYELGTKQEPGTGNGWRFGYDAALYYTDVRNEIVPYRGGRFYFTAGQVGRFGVELGAKVRKECFTLQGAFAYAHYRYLEYTVDSVHYGKPGATADYSGNKIVGVPDFTYVAGLGWTPKHVRGFRADFTVQGTTSYYADDANSVQVDGHTIASLTVGMDRPVSLGGGVGLRGFVSLNNLFDSNYIGAAFLNPDVVNGQPVAFEPGLPRSVVVSASVGWMTGR